MPATRSFLALRGSFARHADHIIWLAAALVLTGCSEVVAPMVSAARAYSGTSHLNTCATAWKNPVDGEWNVAANWTNGLPDATKDACITLDGNYKVSVSGTQSARNLTVGAENGTPVLALAGLFNFSNLTVDGDIENTGIISLSCRSSTTPTATLTVTNGTLQNKPTGVIEAIGCSSGGGRIINADVINDGAVNVAWFLTLNKVNGRFSNNGSVHVTTAGSIAIPAASNHTFGQDAGSLTVDGVGDFAQSSGTFEHNGGVVAGQAPVLQNSTLRFGDGEDIGGGAWRMITSGTLMGDIRAGQTVTIEARGSLLPSTVTAPAGFSNAGTIVLTGTGSTGGTATLIVNGGTLVNEPTGIIRTLVQTGGGRIIQASVENNGLVDIQQISQLDLASRTFTNNGTFNVTSTGSINLTTGGTFIQAAGHLTLNDVYLQTGGAFHLDGGVIDGTIKPVLKGVALRIGEGSTAQGTVRMLANSTITGDVATGQGVVIEGSQGQPIGGTQPAVLTATGSVRNNGVIQLTSIGGNTATLSIPDGSTLTNAGRIETFAGSGGGRTLSGDFVNEGTIQLNVGSVHNGGTLRNVPPGTIAGTQLTLQSTSVFFGAGTIATNIFNQGQFNVGSSPGLLAITGTYVHSSGGALNIEIGGSPANGGTDFDRMTVSGAVTLTNGTLNVSAVNGNCIDGGNSYEVMTFASRSGDFLVKNGLNLGGGHVVTTAPSTTNYKLNVAGPPCVAPDVTPPAIVPTVAGTLGLEGWYVSDVSVTWNVTDAESAISSSTGCGASTVTEDIAGVTFTCSATSAGGTSSQSVTVKRDATAPVVSASRAPTANANGWNNSDVTATFAATDAMSGIAGDATATSLFSTEGENQSGTHAFSDVAGNSATAGVTGISIDKTAPVASAARAPGANANGWNNGDVTATYTATDALSGIDGDAWLTQLFSSEGENQGGSRTFTDLAGNSATASVDGISIDKTAPVVTVTRSPAPGPDGWNETDVTVTYSATDALSGISGANPVSQIFSLGVNQGGSHTFIDLAGNSTTGSITGINVRAPAPPPPPTAVSCSATPNEIWPPNNKMVAVRVTITGAASYSLRSVTNNETGLEDADGWMIGTADIEGRVRATRLGGGGGRIYTLTYDIVNSAGGAQLCVVTVRVPHDQGGR